MLAAGERRSSTANTIQRDPAWRKKDQQGALRVSVEDATSLGLADGDRARVTTRRGSAVAVVEVTDTLMAGHVTLPNGFGLGPGGSSDAVGVAPNELTSTDDRDWFAGTPHHKHVRARVERVPVAGRRGGRGLIVRRTRFDDASCPIARTTDLMGDWWTPLVMREAFFGRRRFEEFQSALDAPRAVLTTRLNRLCDDGMLTACRVPGPSAPPRVPPHRQGPRVLGRARRDVAMGDRLAMARR